MEYKKPALTFEKQVALLAKRGLVIQDRDFAIATLRRISYYRLSAYCIPFQSKKDCFKAGATFEEVLSLYRFDHELRMLIFDALERIEVDIRTSLTYFLAHEFGAFGYLDKSNFHKGFRHDQWVAAVEEEISRSKEIFITHFKAKYKKSKKFPIWMASEIFSFGRLSQLYSGLNYKHQKKISYDYRVSKDVFGAWLHTLVYTRNICAHHARLWNRGLAIQPTFPEKDPVWNTPFSINKNKIIAVLTIVHYLMKHLEGSDSIKTSLLGLQKSYPNVDFKRMGFPENWLEHGIWKL
ncbi:MAG: Abi family protein [Candidatus Omnitrophica bacterium]|nr:Abi family protein [Candidatus Omnitrophota bacterium]MCB9719920.1 Abi family protein [Candidatus Omnitrophota bacterium]